MPSTIAIGSRLGERQGSVCVLTVKGKRDYGGWGANEETEAN